MVSSAPVLLTVHRRKADRLLFLLRVGCHPSNPPIGGKLRGYPQLASEVSISFDWAALDAVGGQLATGGCFIADLTPHAVPQVAVEGDAGLRLRPWAFEGSGGGTFDFCRTDP